MASYETKDNESLRELLWVLGCNSDKLITICSILDPSGSVGHSFGEVRNILYKEKKDDLFSRIKNYFKNYFKR